jgi:uncharacterized protein (DUF1697 family)
MRYVVLLRGINVGGKAKVPMPELRAVFEALGGADVATYINSGNVLVSDERGAAELAGAAEEAIEKAFGFPVAVVVRTEDQIAELCDAIPSEWTNDGEHRTDVMFLRDEADRPGLLDEIEHRPEVEDVRHLAGALVWHVLRKDANRSSARKLAGTELYRQLTIRNVNTVRKLRELLEVNADS